MEALDRLSEVLKQLVLACYYLAFMLLTIILFTYFVQPPISSPAVGFILGFVAIGGWIIADTIRYIVTGRRVL